MQRHEHTTSKWSAVLAVLLAAPALRAAPPAPTSSHPRIWLTPNTVSGLKVQSQIPGSAVARGADRCAKARQDPAAYSMGGWQGFEFVLTLSSCLVSYEASGNGDDLATALKYFNVLLDDYQSVGDGAGGDSVVTHDTGYAMRTFAPYSALAYDWLHDAPGMTESLRSHARARFAAWLSYYSSSGYLNDMPGANYQAGYLFAATLIAIAEAGDAGATGDAHWATLQDVIWGKDMAPALAPGGVLEGGDWPEGWQYGALSVLEYSLAGRALAENGTIIPGMDVWTDALATRFRNSLTPVTLDEFAGGDIESATANLSPDDGPLLAVLAGNASESHKTWMRQLKADLGVTNENPLFDALGDAETGSSAEYPASSPLNHLASGIGTWYLRGAWSADTVWGVFHCAPRVVADHQHNDAGNWVLTRGADDVVVDPSPYGSLSTLTGNAPAIDSNVLPAGYSPSQAGWGTATRLDFAKQADNGIAAARCDYADQFRFESTPSDVSHALRDYVMIPNGGNGTVVLVDRAVTSDPARGMHLRVRSPGNLALAGDVATATVGNSSLAIRALYAPGASSNTRDLPTGPECWEMPHGGCDSSRIPSGTEYRVDLTGPSPSAIHVIDTAAAGAPAPASQLLTGNGYRGALIERDTRRVAVITNDAPDATPGASLAYRVPMNGDSVHVVFDAPAGPEGRSDVTASVDGSDCAVSVTPHLGASGGFDARPLILNVTAGCALSEQPVQPAPGDGSGGASAGGGSGGTPGSADPGRNPTSKDPSSTGGGRNAAGSTLKAGLAAQDNAPVTGTCAVRSAGSARRADTSIAALVIGLFFAFRKRSRKSSSLFTRR